MDVARYLDRIGHRGVHAPSTELLFTLHLAHLTRVPFENLSIHQREPIELRADSLFDKIVNRQRGGFCYELNGAFAELLLALGYSVDRLAARVYGADGKHGIPFDHMCLRVESEGEAFLCDVGFGECFVTPLRFEERDEQHDGRAAFRIEGEQERDLWMRDRSGEWRREYCFTLTPYALADFEPGKIYHTTSPASHFTQKRICSLLTEQGRITLRDDRLIERVGDRVVESPIDADEWRRLLIERFYFSEA